MRKRHVGIGRSAIDFVAHCPALPGGPMESSDIDTLPAVWTAALSGRRSVTAGP